MDRWFSHVFSHHWGICFCFDLPKRRFMARPGRPSPLTRSPSEEVLGLPGRSAAEENVWKISALGRNFFGPQATSRSSRHTDSEHSCIAIWCVLICSYMFLYVLMPVGIFSTRHNQTLKPWPQWPRRAKWLGILLLPLGLLQKVRHGHPKEALEVRLGEVLLPPGRIHIRRSTWATLANVALKASCSMLNMYEHVAMRIAANMRP